MEGSFSFEKVESKTDDLKSVSASLRSMADEREKEIEPEKLKVKNAMEKGNEKQIRIHVKNMVRMRHEVVNYRQISNRLDSVVDYFDKEPEKSKASIELEPSQKTALPEEDKEVKKADEASRTMADEREKEIEPEKLKVMNAMEKGNAKQIRVHAS
ncbi:hypothetical protein C5167_018301 [Papaver somniferum]|uniref:Uncharacterized protein n=1 Tax=Papaver somniferum TaxID=3469 RepID=A0A4Y7ILV6_PAPSO|nr:hypothetical protein C5167_018301 [Papaver somniferum]